MKLASGHASIFIPLDLHVRPEMTIRIQGRILIGIPVGRAVVAETPRGVTAAASPAGTARIYGHRERLLISPMITLPF